MARRAKEVPSETPRKQTPQQEVKKPSWFKIGDEGLKQKEAQDKAAAERKAKFALDFWLNPNETARIIFVDDIGYYCGRHLFKVNGQIVKTTCIKDYETCHICEKGKNYWASYMAHYTIIDLRPYVDKKTGKEVKATRKLFPVKGTAMIKRISDFKKKYGSLVGLVFEVKRYSQQDSTSGSVIDLATNEKGRPFQRVVIADKFDKDMATPIDYEKVLAPPTTEELLSWGIIRPEGIDPFDVDTPGEPLTQDDGKKNDGDELDDIFKS